MSTCALTTLFFVLIAFAVYHFIVDGIIGREALNRWLRHGKAARKARH
jgi:hypothetical protein